MMQRMQAQQLLNSCGGGGGDGGSMDFSSSPTQMQLGPSDNSLSYVRGSVVGNLLIWLACVAVACAVAKVVQLRRRDDDSSWDPVAAELGLPGRLYWPYSMLSVPTLTSSTMLLIPTGNSRTVRPADAVLGALGIVVCTASAACVALITTGRRFRATALPLEARSVPDVCFGIQPTIFMRCKKWARLELSSRWEWVDRRRARGFVQRWGALFYAYGKGRQWFAAIELGASAAAAVLAGLAPLDTGDGAVCQDLQVVSAVTAVAFLASVVLLRPYGLPVDGHIAQGNAAATAASSVLGVLGIDTVILTAAQAIVNGLWALAAATAFAASHFWSTRRNQIVDVRLSIAPRRPGTLHQIVPDLHLCELDLVLRDLIRIICENRQHSRVHVSRDQKL